MNRLRTAKCRKMQGKSMHLVVGQALGKFTSDAAGRCGTLPGPGPAEGAELLKTMSYRFIDYFGSSISALCL